MPAHIVAFLVDAQVKAFRQHLARSDYSVCYLKLGLVGDCCRHHFSRALPSSRKASSRRPIQRQIVLKIFSQYTSRKKCGSYCLRHWTSMLGGQSVRYVVCNKQQLSFWNWHGIHRLFLHLLGQQSWTFRCQQSQQMQKRELSYVG